MISAMLGLARAERRYRAAQHVASYRLGESVEVLVIDLG
jgi:hypothetical protein